jgi:hypothetical protein
MDESCDFPWIYNVSNGLWLFGCLASLDGPLVTNSLFFSDLSEYHHLLGIA